MHGEQAKSELRLRRSGSWAEPWSRFGAFLGAMRSGFGGAVRMWAERQRTRRQLNRLSDHMLRDIGISRGDASHEIEKPFWRK